MRYAELFMSHCDSLEILSQRWQREIKACQSVTHPNILPILGFCENPDAEYKELKGIVLPYCANGDARVYINAHPEVDCMSIVRITSPLL